MSRRHIAFTSIALCAATTLGSIAQSVQSIDPKRLLFSTPTLNDALPGLDPDRLVDERTQFTHEDNWRQFELIARTHQETINRELAAIDQIWREKSVPVGKFSAFRDVHVRKTILHPLDIPFSKEEFEKLTGSAAVGMAFLDGKHEIKDVYAIRVKGFLFYAQIIDGHLAVLGLEQESEERLDDETASRIGAFVDKNQLILVHWRSRSVLFPTANLIGYLTGKKV